MLYKKTSLESGAIPDDWRSARIVPIDKSRFPLKLNNYRPLSLTSPTCRLLGHILFKAIMLHIENNILLRTNQHGFSTGLSTLTLLAEKTDDFLNALNMRGQIDAVFLDSSKEFDVVSNAYIVTKRLSMGIENNLVRWILRYLSSRKQYVAVNYCVSDRLVVYSGEPSESVLALLMFLVYIIIISLSTRTAEKGLFHTSPIILVLY